ncbi:hypothetical protein M3Y97_00209800 [Aphelenchoides bicaudatus]|nr:hypothetical protein M3Y97_00209800 [Aphelenchoides bicaudatus]
MGKHSKRDRDYDQKHDSKGGSSKSLQKEIDLHKKTMADRLNSAIDDIKQMEQSEHETKRHNDDYPLTISETLKRNTQIDRIEQSGFTPATFVSSRSHRKTKDEQVHEDHEGALFGAAWKTKELSKKLASKNETAKKSVKLDSIPMPTGVSSDPDFNDFPLAQKWLNTDPNERQERWKKLFLDQRRQLFEGEL